MITIVAKCTLRAGVKNEFKAAVQPLIEGSQNEPGNISYNLFEDLSDENIVAFIEQWEDGKAIVSHNVSDHFLAGLEVIKSFSENVEITQYGKL